MVVTVSIARLALHFIDVLAGCAGFSFPTLDLSLSFCFFIYIYKLFISFHLTLTALTHQLGFVSHVLRPRCQHVDVGVAGLFEFVHGEGWVRWSG